MICSGACVRTNVPQCQLPAPDRMKLACKGACFRTNVPQRPLPSLQIRHFCGSGRRPDKKVTCLALRRQLHAGDARAVGDDLLCHRERAVAA